MVSFVMCVCGHRKHTRNGVTGFYHDRARNSRTSTTPCRVLSRSIGPDRPPLTVPGLPFGGLSLERRSCRQWLLCLEGHPRFATSCSQLFGHRSPRLCVATGRSARQLSRRRGCPILGRTPPILTSTTVLGQRLHGTPPNDADKSDLQDDTLLALNPSMPRPASALRMMGTCKMTPCRP